MKILMLIAHPDDEVIFGYTDLIRDVVHVICFTNKDHSVRSVEFANSIKHTKQTGIIMILPLIIGNK